MDHDKIAAKIAQGDARRVDALRRLEQSPDHQEFIAKQVETMKERGRAHRASRINYLPVDEAATRYQGVTETIRNAWWCVDPEKGLMFYNHWDLKNRLGSPQCNADQRVAELVRARLWPEAELRQIPLVIVPWHD